MADLYISGLTGKLDTGTMIDSILKVKSQPLQVLAQKKAVLQTKSASLSNLLGVLKDFQSTLNSIDTSKFAQKKATVSDTNILSATASSSAPNISMNVSVLKLAQTEIRASSQGVSSLNTTFSSSGTLTINYRTSDTASESFQIDYSAEDTLNDLVSKINSSQSRVKASVYYTGNDYRLMLTEADPVGSSLETTATDFAINATGLPTELGDLNDTIQNAQNAEIKIGNSENTIKSSTNTFTQLVSGLDVTVKTTGTAQISISDDYSAVDSTLNKIASSYNSVISLVNSLTGKGAQFQGDSSVSQIKNSMLAAIQPLFNAGLINYSEKDGTISINTDRLNALKESDISKVQSLVEQTVSNLKKTVDARVTSLSNIVSTADNQIQKIDSQISLMQERLAKEEERLRKEFAQLENFINKMDEISTKLQSFIVSLSEMTKGGK
ncbi:flagellar filament capping protein FliD [Thermodesulfovibrio hydrogeniphilus]